MGKRLKWAVSAIALCGSFLLVGCEAPWGRDAASDPAAHGPRPPTERDLMLAELFPSTGVRGYVVNNCSSCHAAACGALGQRSQARWSEIEASHQDYIPGLSTQDRGMIFDYLRKNFNDTLPEPAVPAELLRDGCPAN